MNPLETRLAEILALPEPERTDESIKAYASVLHEVWEVGWRRRKQENYDNWRGHYGKPNGGKPNA